MGLLGPPNLYTRIKGKIMEKNIYSRYNTPKSKGLKCGKGLTEQHHKDGLAVKSILDKYARTGVAPQPRPDMKIGDFTNTMDFQTAMNYVAQVQNKFSTLPSDVRDHFRNDPARFYNFMSDSKNEAKAIELGILQQPEKKSPSVNKEQEEPIKGDASQSAEITPENPQGSSSE